MTSHVHDIGALDDYVNRKARRIQVGTHVIVVVRWGDQIYALRDTCAHQGAPLSSGTLGYRITASSAGDPVLIDTDTRVLRCPWHGWQYDLCTGRSLVNPERARVKVFDAHVDDGRVYVNLR